MKKILAVLVSICLAGGLFCGCQKQVKKPAPQSQVQQTNESEIRIMANKFSTLAEKTAGINKATVVVSSVGQTIPTATPGTNTAGNGTIAGRLVVMVGLTLDSAAAGNKSKENSIKTEVKKNIMASDKRVSDVLVTTDPNMVKKITDVAAGIIEGRPVQSSAKDVKELNRMLEGQVK